MKKILVLFVALIAVISTLSIGTYAYFQDTETSSTNSITAGTLDLTIAAGNANHNIIEISAANGYPGNSGTSYTLLKNVGSFSGELDIIFGTATNTESTGSTEFEADGGAGELGGVATVVIWLDFDGDGADFDNGVDIVLLSDGSTSTDAADYAAAADTVDSYDSNDYDAILTMAANDEIAICVDWQIPHGGAGHVDNSFQGDAVSFSASFVLEQAGVDS